jgi:hypothetical protein
MKSSDIAKWWSKNKKLQTIKTKTKRADSSFILYDSWFIKKKCILYGSEAKSHFVMLLFFPILLSLYKKKEEHFKLEIKYLRLKHIKYI